MNSTTSSKPPSSDLADQQHEIIGLDCQMRTGQADRLTGSGTSLSTVVHAGASSGSNGGGRGKPAIPVKIGIRAEMSTPDGASVVNAL
jgi:hypothetical protein